MKSVVLIVYCSFSLILVAQNDRTTANNGAPFYSNGYHTIYNKQALLWQEGIFKDGKLSDGKVYVFDKDGILLKVEIYKSGVYCLQGKL